MGISFFYIGRDAHTLKDKLPFSYDLDALPKEMNHASIIGVETNAINVTRILTTLGLPESFNLSQIISAVPPWFNLSDPVVDAPVPPFLTTLNRILAGTDWIDLGRWLMIMTDAMLRIFLPTLPEQFKISSTVLPGGINVSEFEILMDAVFEALGIPDPYRIAERLGQERAIAGPMHSLALRKRRRS